MIMMILDLIDIHESHEYHERQSPRRFPTVKGISISSPDIEKAGRMCITMPFMAHKAS